MYMTILRDFGFAAFSYIAVTSVAGVFEHYSLAKNDSEFFTIDALPPVLEHREQPNLDTLESDVSDIISEFVDTLKEIPHINLTNFYYRFNPNNIDLKYRPSKTTKVAGYITLDDSKDLRAQLIPYLIEQAITIYGTDFRARGFERSKTDDSKNIVQCGELITDAYIKILAERYFGLYDREFSNMDRDIVLYIESLVGREYMERAFFRSRIDEVVDFLSIYVHRKDVIKMIRELDHLGKVRESHIFATKMLSLITYRDVIIKLLSIAQMKLALNPTATDKETKEIIHKTVELIDNTYQEGIVKYSSSPSTIRIAEDFFKRKLL